MRPIASLRSVVMATALTGIAGCVFSILPANKTPPADKPSAVAPTPAPDPSDQETHHDAHYYRCKAGVKPVSTEDRPKLGDVETGDKTKLSTELAGYIHQLDQYMDSHQRKEEKAYRAWRSECDDFLN